MHEHRLQGGSMLLSACGTALLAVACWCCCAPDLTAWMHNLLSFSAQRPVPRDGPVDVAVVLGYALHRNGSCTRPLQSRVEVGVSLYEQGAATHLLFSGAHPGDGLRNVTEANAMLQYALQLAPQGTRPAGSWLLEEGSTSTRTNAVYSLALIQQPPAHQGGQQPPAPQASGPEGPGRRWRRVAIVTNPFHQRRSYWVFKQAAAEAGLDVQFYVAAAPFAGHAGWGHPCLDRLADQLDFWRELAALAYYRCRGWLG